MHTTPTYIHATGDATSWVLRVADGFCLIYSRGDFISPLYQTQPDEKSVYLVPLVPTWIVQHDAEATHERAVQELRDDDALHGVAVICPLHWGETYSLRNEKHPRLMHLKFELCVAPGGIPDDRDSPPPKWAHRGDPQDFSRLGRMAALLR